LCGGNLQQMRALVQQTTGVTSYKQNVNAGGIGNHHSVADPAGSSGSTQLS
jgi:hypothetical protein